MLMNKEEFKNKVLENAESYANRCIENGSITDSISQMIGDVDELFDYNKKFNEDNNVLELFENEIKVEDEDEVISLLNEISNEFSRKVIQYFRSKLQEEKNRKEDYTYCVFGVAGAENNKLYLKYVIESETEIDNIFNFLESKGIEPYTFGCSGSTWANWHIAKFKYFDLEDWAAYKSENDAEYFENINEDEDTEEYYNELIERINILLEREGHQFEFQDKNYIIHNGSIFKYSTENEELEDILHPGCLGTVEELSDLVFKMNRY